MAKLGALWRGEVPLDQAFWTWAVTVGLIINITTSVLFLTMLTLDRPWAALALGYVVSVPYNIVAVVGVWRAADRYQGPAVHADLARWTTAILMLVLTLT